VMNQVLWSPPQAGQNISEWAKQQACRKRALETDVPVVAGLDRFLVDRMDARSDDRKQREDQRVTDGLAAVSEVVTLGAGYWQRLRAFARENKIASAEEDSAIGIACGVPKKIPADWQAVRALEVRKRCEDAGFEGH
jgi:hypothetical protein